jgi:putative proteasome-type protease
MTFCLGVKVAKGIVAISDSRITSGTEVSSKKKMFTFEGKQQNLFIMTSGLRSVRDKVMTYFEETLEEESDSYDKLYKAVNAFGDKLRKVAKQDKAHLMSAGLHFNLWSIIGGQMKNDQEHKLFLVYPEGNWIEVTQGSPFIIIGNSGFGKPILNRNIKYETSLKEVLKLGFLAFDSTRVSANDVDFPIDVLIYENNNFQFSTANYDFDDLESISSQWNNLLNESVQKLPINWAENLLSTVSDTE